MNRVPASMVLNSHGEFAALVERSDAKGSRNNSRGEGSGNRYLQGSEKRMIVHS